MIKKLFLAVLCAALLCPAIGWGLGDRPVTGSITEENLAPNFTLPNLKGKDVELAAYKGKVVFLNFWTTWCPACRSEMPSMEELWRKLERRDFILLAVSMDSERPAVERFVKSGGYTFPVLLDPQSKVADKFGIMAIPTTFIIDKKGRIIEKVVGGRNWSSKEYLKKFEDIIK